MPLDFRIVEKVEYSKDIVQLAPEEYWDIITKAKELQLPLIMRIKDYYGVEGDVYFASHEIDDLISEVDILLKQDFEDKNIVVILQELKELLLHAKADYKPVESLSD